MIKHSVAFKNYEVIALLKDLSDGKTPTFILAHGTIPTILTNCCGGDDLILSKQ